jgi:hypothetical protein
MPKPTYKIVERDKRYFVFGYVGAGKYMQCSEGYRRYADAVQRMRLNCGSERAAKAELLGWNGTSIND